ncbi:unnamed protein product [Orchesella dallaii]|uniref:Uncharacterized protein n=1 Tax=Orchesella dallaii TaxID=48710 RepID=A0ABP1QIU5_9HEXA
MDSNNRLIKVHSAYSNVYTINTHLINVEKEECDSNKMSESDTSRMTQCQTCDEISLHVEFLNFFYYLLLIPFKMGLDTETNQFRIQTQMVQQGNELYRRLKKKMDVIAHLYGNQILAFYITSLTYYAQAPHVFLGKRGNAEKLAMGYYTLNIVVWIVAAEFHKNVQVTVQKWIVYHTENPNLSIEDGLKLVSLSNEMAADPVALACRYFYVTYQQFNSVGAFIIKWKFELRFQGHVTMQCYNCSNIDSSRRLIKVHSGYSNVYVVNTRRIKVEKKEWDSNKMSECYTSRMTQCQTCDEISFLVEFFNFFYYLLLIPFKTVLVTETNQFRIQTQMVQKILCLFCHTAVMFVVIHLALLCGVRLQFKLEPSLVELFDMVSIIFHCVSNALLIFMVWRKREEFLEMVGSTRVSLRRAKEIKILTYMCLTILCIAYGAVNWQILHDDLHYASLHTLEKSFSGRNFLPNNSASLPSSRNNYEYILYLGLGLVFAHASLCCIVIPGSFLILVLTTRQLGKTLETELKIGKKVLDIQKGMKLYRRLKKKLDAIAHLYGHQILTFYITSLTYYAQAPHVFLGKRGNAEKLIMGYYTVSGVVWIVAAEFHKHVQVTVQKWIVYHTENTNLSIEDRLKLVSLSNEMAADPIALACRYFYVTYQQFNSVSANALNCVIQNLLVKIN